MVKRFEILYRVLDIVSEETGVPVDNILATGQKREVADCRKMFCHAIKLKPDWNFSLNNIGSVIGKDHATVLDNSRKAADLVATNKYFARTFNRIMARLAVPDVALLIEEFDNVPQL